MMRVLCSDRLADVGWRWRSPRRPQPRSCSRFTFGVGGFLPRGFDSRVDGRRARRTISATTRSRTTASLDSTSTTFRGPTIFGEWNVSLRRPHRGQRGRRLSQPDRARAVYRDLVNGEHGRAIRRSSRTLKLRMTPITGVVRFLPFGRPATSSRTSARASAPCNFRYTETGEFVDHDGRSTIFPRHATRRPARRSAPCSLGGVRIPISGDIYGLNVRSTAISGPSATRAAPANGFLGDKIDLSGGRSTSDS